MRQNLFRLKSHPESTQKQVAKGRESEAGTKCGVKADSPIPRGHHSTAWRSCVISFLGCLRREERPL